MLTEDVEITVADAEFTKHGYHVEATLCIQPGRGRYVVSLWTLDDEEREVAWEPSEPDRQTQSVEWAFANPKDAVLDCIEIDKHRRSES
jgi:hypothetical protein